LNENKKELDALTKQHFEMIKKLENLENKLEETRNRNGLIFAKQADEIQALRESNQLYQTELDYWERFTRNKLESEILTYRSILNSQLELMASSATNAKLQASAMRAPPRINPSTYGITQSQLDSNSSLTLILKKF
jgi:hypothetical protein